jgi:hypothetical protein
MKRARDLVHKGHSLAAHPLAGSLRLLSNPCRSVVLRSPQGDFDSRSVSIVEDAYFRLSQVEFHPVPDQALRDYELLDFFLIEGVLREVNAATMLPFSA